MNLNFLVRDLEDTVSNIEDEVGSLGDDLNRLGVDGPTEGHGRAKENPQVSGSSGLSFLKRTEFAIENLRDALHTLRSERNRIKTTMEDENQPVVAREKV